MNEHIENLLNILIEKVNLYNPEGLSEILKAYKTASKEHANQFRESGEPYINHPLEVAIILADIQMDTNTIVAGLLHDIVEDTNMTIQDVEKEFGTEVAILVDGVTNFGKIYFKTREERKLANNRKVVMGIVKDIRIIIIKLADRLHNMRTLKYKKPEKQKEIAIATRDIFVPVANKLGLNRIKNELEDLSFSYIDPEAFKRVVSKLKREQLKENYNSSIEEMFDKIKKILEQREIPYNIKIRVKNYYSIYKDLISEYKSLNNSHLSTIHDLVSFKIMLDSIDSCYLMLRPIHEAYKPVNGTFKDYICNPKANMYQSLHTTVYGPKNRQIQIQIKTEEMGRVASFGLVRYWNIKDEEERSKLQTYVKNRYPLYDSILELDKAYGDDDKEFVEHLKEELTSITVINADGKEIELPPGSTIVDFAYALGEKIGNRLAIATVNDQIVENDYVLKDQDQVRIVTSVIGEPKEEWLGYAKTAKAQNMILKYTCEKKVN